MTGGRLGIVLGVGVLFACAKGESTRDRDAPQTAQAVTASSNEAGTAQAGKPFGAYCVTDAECAGGVCFHKRIKGADAGPERREVHPEAEEHDGYCSMRCNSDSDCPTPLTRGKCGARGMCKRAD
jgi:hypothetical protein